MQKKGARRIGIPAECARIALHPDVKKTFEATRARLAAMGCTLEAIPFPTLEHVVSSYYVSATAEASANLARFDGVRYGSRAPGAENPEGLMTATRNAGFGDEVKLRILLGTYVLRSGFQDQYYLRAQRIRTAIRNDFARAFAAVGSWSMMTRSKSGVYRSRIVRMTRSDSWYNSAGARN